MYNDALNAIPGGVDSVYNASHGENIVSYWFGTNPLAGGSTPASVYGTVTSYAAARKAVGWEVMVFSILPRSAASGTFETDRQTYNALLRADFNVPTSDPNVWLPHAGITYADIFIDVGNDVSIGQAGQNTTGPYISDSIHLNSGGYEIVARHVINAINVIR